MAVNLNEFMVSLAQFDPTKSIDQINPPPGTIHDLRMRILEANSELCVVFLNRNLQDESIRNLKQSLIQFRTNQAASHILGKIEDSSAEKVPLSRTLQQLETLSAKLIAYAPPKVPVLGFIPFMMSSHRLLSSRIDVAEQPLPCDLVGIELIKAVKELKSSDEITRFAQTIDYDQVIQIVSSEQSDASLPRLLTSLAHSVFSELLIRINDSEASAINRKLMCVRNEAWFSEKFKQIRENFVNVCNQQAAKIDNLNREIRRISVQDISHETIDRIEALREETRRAWEAQKRLQVLIKNIIIDRETSHLFRKELPIRYKGLIQRLSDKENDQRAVSGCPYGIIYRIAFDDYALSDDEEPITDRDELQNELLSAICVWIPNWRDWIEVGIIEKPSAETLERWNKDGVGAYQEGIKNLGKLNISSIDDLKKLRIFNSSMLKEYLQI